MLNKDLIQRLTEYANELDQVGHRINQIAQDIDYFILDLEREDRENKQ